MARLCSSCDSPIGLAMGTSTISPSIRARLLNLSERHPQVLGHQHRRHLVGMQEAWM